MKERAYHEKVNLDNELKLREHLQTLPHFCRDFYWNRAHDIFPDTPCLCL